jgi:hypothetical protein
VSGVLSGLLTKTFAAEIPFFQCLRSRLQSALARRVQTLQLCGLEDSARNLSGVFSCNARCVRWSCLAMFFPEYMDRQAVGPKRKALDGRWTEAMIT